MALLISVVAERQGDNKRAQTLFDSIPKPSRFAVTVTDGKTISVLASM